MTDWRHAEPEDWLDRDLRQLAGGLRFPPTPAFRMPSSAHASDPDVAVSPIPFSLGSGPSRQHRWAGWRPVLAGLAACLVLIVTFAVPEVRHATADLLGFPGIRIEFGNRADDPPPTVTSIGGTLLLGEPITLESASQYTTQPLLVPGDHLAGMTPEVYLNAFQGVPVISLLYSASDDLPEIGSTGVGLLLMAIDDNGSSQYLMIKRAVGETPPLTVTVNGHNGLWVEGGILTVDASDPFWTFQRRSGNVLLWVQDGMTYRMESSLSLEEALAVAESLHPVEPEQ